ncbi:SET domain-containing protein [Massilia sp. TS11]|uniref:SET domain-containing protein n=1 Tax=Massilia sp. TS11 TaxID=2908003 RepID=UPI001EDB7955|nr:SET domain-containing protein [Massilia sp. TS11]MCG2586479.1 SET domain-containing protein [Massilia sp. TS11]
MIHPDTQLVFINEKVGRGVVATKPIPKGTLVWNRCAFDIVLPPQQVASLPAPYKHIAEVWGYVDDTGDTVLCWDLARFVNHACDPAMLPLGNALEIAVRDIGVGEELTCDYGACNYENAMACSCGAANCRGLVRPTDALAEAARWNDKVRAALDAAPHVAQPLLPYLLDRAEWDGYLDGSRALPDPAIYVYAGKREGA